MTAVPEGVVVPRAADALVLLSSWCEPSATTETDASRRHADVMLAAGWLDATGGAYARETARRALGIAPLSADLSGLSPALILAGAAEILPAESRRLAARMAAAGVSVTLSEWLTCGRYGSCSGGSSLERERVCA